MKARGAKNRDPGGLYVQSLKLVRDEKSPAADRQVIVAYADLDIARGEHQLAYQITVLRGGKVALVEATPLSRVTISDRPRDQMLARTTTAKLIPQKRRVEAIVLGERTRGAPAPVTQSAMDVSTNVEATAKTAPVAVNIPGGFARATAPSPTTVKPATAVNPSDAASLADRPWYPASAVASPNDRTVFFATNRKHLDAPQPGQPAFGVEAAEQVTYGACVVNFPVQHHTKGNFETPSWWEQRNLDKFFAVDSATVMSKDEFARSLGPSDVLLFVHGFNNTFDDAVLRTAQLQYDLEFPGPAVAFCWPSAGDIGQYKADSDSAAASTSALAEVIRTLLDRVGESLRDSQPASQRDAATWKPPKLHIIAHSMGNRVLLNALFALYDGNYLKDGTRPLGQIVLAAPDVGATMFNNLIPYATDFSQQVTYYYCDSDTALIASRQINLYEPVGLLPLFEQNVRTICADQMDTSFIGHGYFSSSPKVLLDMQLILTAGLDPDHRMPPLVTRTKIFGHPYWSFTADQLAAATTGK